MSENNLKEREPQKNREINPSSFQTPPVDIKEPHWLVSFLCGIGLAILPPIVIFFFVTSTFTIAKNSAASWAVDFWVLIGTIYLFFRSEKLKPQNRRVIELSLLIAAISMFVTKFYFFGIPP